MNFPKIEHIGDVLPHIEGHEDFFVADRGHFKVINYRSMLAFGDLFPSEPPFFDESEAFRRECRGIKFYPDGRIMARPFHKFFNVNERPETRVERLPWHTPHHVEIKHDGSMIHIGAIGNGHRFMTKMGPTAVAARAEEECMDVNMFNWLADELAEGRTHLLEYVSPNNTIVVRHKRPQLIWLACRETITGKYLGHESFTRELNKYGLHYTERKHYAKNASWVLMNHIRDLEGSEGVVVSWPDGVKVKIKSDWYSLLHKKKEILSSPKDALELILNDQIDDLVPILDETDGAKILALAARVRRFWDHGARIVAGAVNTGRKLKWTKKDFATSAILAEVGEVHEILKSVAFKTWETAALDEHVPPAVIYQWAYENLQDRLMKLTTSNAKAKTLESAIGPLAVVSMFGDEDASAERSGGELQERVAEAVG